MNNKELEIAQAIPDLFKETSTSGSRFILKRGANGHFKSEEKAEGIFLSVENLSALLNTFRGQDPVTGNQFQVQIGPNGLKDIYLPFTDFLIISSDSDLKIASISLVKSANLSDYDIIHPPSSFFIINSKTKFINPDKSYRLESLSNVSINTTGNPGDYLYFQLTGSDIVIRSGDLRLRAKELITYSRPMGPDIQTISVGSSKPYDLKLAYLQKKRINPAFVSPEATLWSFTNEALQ